MILGQTVCQQPTIIYLQGRLALALHMRFGLCLLTITACMQKVSKTEAGAPSLPDFHLVVHVASVKAEGKPYAVVGIAAGAASGGPDLEGLLLHWACVSGQGQEWQQPPSGWHTDPDFSQGAGEGPCQQSCLEGSYNASVCSSCSLGVLLQSIRLHGAASCKPTTHPGFCCILLRSACL